MKKLFWLVIIISFLFLGIPNVVRADEWSQFAHDPQRTAYNPQELLSDGWQVKWIWNKTVASNCQDAFIETSTCRSNNYTVGSHTCLSQSVEPITGNGKVYIGTLDGRIIALNENSGQQEWEANTGLIEHTGAYDSETQSVYFASRNGRLYRLNSSNGQIITTMDLDGEVLAAPLLVGDHIFIGTTTGRFYSLNKVNFDINWNVSLPTSIVTPAAYSASRNLIIVGAENMSVYALNANNGFQAWNRQVNGDTFCHSYPVVSDIHDVVFIVSHLPNACNKLWGAGDSRVIDTSTVEQIRDWINQNASYESYFALRLADGSKAYTVPILFAGHELHYVGGCDDRDVLPPPVLRKISGNKEVAYVPYRNKQACSYPDVSGGCDPRGDATLGEMDVDTGNIRFLQINEQVNRIISDEFDFMSMAGDILFHNNWQSLGAQRIVDRSPGLGNSFNNPIRSDGVYAMLHSIWSEESCVNSQDHFCSGEMCAPPDCSSCDSKKCYGKGFFIYTSDRYSAINQDLPRNIHSPISNGVVYQRTFDGTIMAIATSGDIPSPPPTPFCAGLGDVDCDGGVDKDDALMVLRNFGKDPSQVAGYHDPIGDAKINGFDLGYIIKSWGK